MALILTDHETYTNFTDYEACIIQWGMFWSRCGNPIEQHERTDMNIRTVLVELTLDDVVQSPKELTPRSQIKLYHHLFTKLL